MQEPSAHDRKLSKHLMAHSQIINVLHQRLLRIESAVGDFGNLPQPIIDEIHSMAGDIAKLQSVSVEVVDEMEAMKERVQILENYILPPTQQRYTTEKIWDVNQPVQQSQQPSVSQNRQSISQSFQSVSQLKPSGNASEGRIASGEYDEYIRVCRRSRIAVQDIADDLGVSKSGVERRITVMKKRHVL